MVPALSDGAGFLDLVQRHSGALGRFARRLVGSQDDAEEIVQEALLRAYAHRMHLTAKPHDLKASVYRITHNLSVDHLRKKRASTIDKDVLEARSQAHSLTPDEQLYIESLRAAVRQAVDDLPADYRDVIVLRFGMGLTYRAMARAMGISLPAVESRLHRAKARLRTRLKPWASTPPREKGRGRRKRSPRSKS